jgi:hypothetical protein
MQSSVGLSVTFSRIDARPEPQDAFAHVPLLLKANTSIVCSVSACMVDLDEGLLTCQPANRSLQIARVYNVVTGYLCSVVEGRWLRHCCLL